MYIDISQEGFCVNLSQLVAFKAVSYGPGSLFNNETLTEEVHCIDFVSTQNQITMRFPTKADRDMVFSRAQQLGQAWAAAIMRGANKPQVAPALMVPKFSGH